MNISFADIARISATMGDNETLVVSGQGQVAKLGAHEVQAGLPKGMHILSQEEFLEALERVTNKECVDRLRNELEGGVPLSARSIKTVVAASRAEVETESHLRNLTSGLKAKAEGSVPADFLEGLVQELMGDKAAAAVLTAPTCQKALSDYNTARRAVRTAKENVGQGRDPALITALAEAEGDFAAAVHALAAAVRAQMAERSFAVDNVLAAFDDYATEMEVNANRLEEAAATLNFADLDRLLGRTQNLPANDAAVDYALAKFEERAKPFLATLAKIDTLTPEDPDVDVPALLNAAALGWNVMSAGLEQLRQTPGLDPKAVRELAANLAAMKTRLDACAANVRAQMQSRIFEHIYTMLKDIPQRAINFYGNANFRKVWNRIREAETEVASLVRLLETRPEAERAQALVKAVEDHASDLHDAIWDVLVRVDSDSDVMDILGMHDFKARLQSLRDAYDAGAFEHPAESLDVRRLGEVLRGETGLLEYLTLKQANLPEEMFHSELDIEHAEFKGHAGSGVFNSVDFYDIKDIRTGRTERYVMKNVELSQDQGAHCGIASRFSMPSHGRNSAKLNYASWKSAFLIGCGTSITRSGVVRLGGHYQLVQETAPGDDLAKIRDKNLFQERTKNYDIATKRRIWREMHIACAKLEWADWLSGQLDRTVLNEMFDFKVEEAPGKTPHVEVSLKGIDNDASFPERRTGIYTFVNSKNHEIVNSQTFDYQSANALVSKGVRGMRRPVFLPLSVKAKIEALSPEQFANEMRPYLSPLALQAAIARFSEMKDAVASWPKDRLLDDRKGVDTMSDAEVEAQVNSLDTIFGEDYRNLRMRIGERCMSNVGGFYGYLIGLCNA